MSKIEWTDETWNPVVGCTPVSPGCLNCYAARMGLRLESMPKMAEYHPRLGADGQGKDGQPIRIAEVRGGRPVFTGDVRTLPDRLTQPLHWREPRMVFVNSMSDLFHESVPFEFIDRVFAVMALCPRHTFQLLTKRPERMAKYLSFRSHGGVTFYEPPVGREHLSDRILDRLGKGFNWPLPNVWLGASCENQKTAEERIPHLLRCPAAVRFLSCEPLLGPIDLRRVPNTSPPMPGCPGGRPSRRVDWVIVGGESGPGSRPCDVAWIRAIVTQCKDSGVPVFVKQIGARVHCRNDEVSEWLDEVGMGLDFIDTLESCMQGDPVRVMLTDRAGRDMAEWPEDLRVRQWPASRQEVTR